MTTLTAVLDREEDDGLIKVITAISDACRDISGMLTTGAAGEVGTSNELGDRQLAADVAADSAMFAALRASGAVAVASSEETPRDEALGGAGYSVAFDPLDGSSVLPAGWAVGTIFGVWPGAGLLGRTGKEQVAAGYALYGPRTLLVLARGLARGAPKCQEFLLDRGAGGAWVLARDLALHDGVKIFAPANLRSAADNAAYQALVLDWMAQRYTLRYSGALVPDLHHALAKGGGVFCSPVSRAAPAKLRLLYEVAPLSYVAVAAGGAARDGRGDALAGAADRHDRRGPVCLGSVDAVLACEPAMAAGWQA